MTEGWGREALRTLGGPLAALAVLVAFNALFTPGFLELEIREGRLYGVPVDILQQGSRIAIVALGMSLVIATAGVDLSVGAVAAIAGAVAAVALRDGGHAPGTAVSMALGASLACGLLNGALVVCLRLQPIVATLILMVAGRGVAQLVTDGLIVTFDEPGFAGLANAAFLGLPRPLWWMVGLFVATAAIVRGSNLGLFIEAVGGNAAASRLAGVPDRRVRVSAYLFCAGCAGLAGVLECSYIQAADANNAGQLLELDAILAVVIGGTALTGGRFSLPGAVLGALILQTLTTTLYMQDVSADVAPAPKALAVLAVCLLGSPPLRARLRELARGGGAAR
ncbi:MAG: ABC transporter permease [Planctomycetota bacterium]